MAGSKLESATFTVDVASITSPESGRDNQFRGEDIMDAAQFPTAEFRVTQPVDVSAVPETGASITLHRSRHHDHQGRQPRRDARRWTFSGPATTSSPWDPSRSPGPTSTCPHRISGFVKVEPTGTIEFLVNLAKQ